MDLLGIAARRAVRSHTGKIMEHIRDGWNAYSFLFFIGGVAAILGSILGVESGVAVILTLVFFYYAGKFRKKVEEENERLNKAKEMAKKGKT